MFPKRPEWKSWSAIEKATYVAQIAAALSLLPTVIFASLGWREARLARSEQMQFFIAEKAPDLEVTSIRILPISADEKGIITFFLRNIGGSPAKGLHISLIKLGETNPIRETATEDKDFWKRVLIPKGKELSIPFIRVEELQGKLGWQPETARIFRSGDKLESGEQIAAILHIGFTGEFNDEHDILENVAMKIKTPNPAVQGTLCDKAAPRP